MDRDRSPWTGGHGVYVTGVGYSDIARDSGRTEGALAVEAARRAIADAGLDRNDIDGMTMFPVRSNPPVAFQGPSLDYVQRSLGLNRLRLQMPVGSGAGQLQAVLAAYYALAAGQADHVVVYRSHLRQARRFLPFAAESRAAFDEDAFTAPYGGTGGAARLAMWAQRHMYEYGTTQEQMGAVSVLCRAHASTNPRAVWQTPVTLDEYMASRWVAEPFKLLDCDYPVDGAVALVLSRQGPATDTRAPVRVECTGHGTGPDTSWLQWRDYTEMGSRYAAEDLWSKTALKPTDVDVAELYDGFTWLTICWLEDLGFVQKGEGGPYFEAGNGYVSSPGLSICTDGGQLGVGRLHGFGKVAQAVNQLRGEAGANQHPGAEVALASAGGGPGGAAVLLTTNR